jgi:hypothetical protein
MRFYHRTSLPPEEVLAEADRYFESIGTPAESEARTRAFACSVGRISLDVRPEGGHYTRVTVETDQIYQGEAEKLAKGFFTTVHQKAHPAHVSRGAH